VCIVDLAPHCVNAGPQELRMRSSIDYATGHVPSPLHASGAGGQFVVVDLHQPLRVLPVGVVDALDQTQQLDLQGGSTRLVGVVQYHLRQEVVGVSDGEVGV